MNVYQYHNITLQIEWDPQIGEEMSPDPSNNLGFCKYEYPKKHFKKFKKSDEFAACTRLIEEKDSNPDIFISFLDWYDNYGPDEQIIIKVTADHPFWVFHDICHCKNRDVTGCEGNITAYIERDRLEKGLELWQQETEGRMEYEYRGYIKKAFQLRFQEAIKIPFFQHWEEDMYNEWSEEDQEEDEHDFKEDLADTAVCLQESGHYD